MHESPGRSGCGVAAPTRFDARAGVAALAAISVIGSFAFVVWVNLVAAGAEQMKRDFDEKIVATTFEAVRMAEVSQRVLEHELEQAVTRRDRAAAAAERWRAEEGVPPPGLGTRGTWDDS